MKKIRSSIGCPSVAYVATIVLLSLLSTKTAIAQTLPIDFESGVTTSSFTDFDGGVATVISNPQQSGINTSATVAQIVRNGGQIWAGSKIVLSSNLDFSTNNTISMKVFTSAPVGTVVKFKLEGTGDTERDRLTTVSNQWETLTWDFTGAPSDFNQVVFMFDFGNVGDGSANSTFLFDDIEQIYGGTHIDLPVNFEGSTVNYTVTDFGGNISELVVDPTNSNNHVIKVIKPTDAAAWAGTTIGTPAGFATDIPLSLTESKMTVRVWSPAAGTPIRLKVEDSDDPTHTCETETNTTLSGAWEYLEFDFSNEAPGTAALSFGLSNGWTYNMASIFFNFGTDGATAGKLTYYFDEVQFGAKVVNTKNLIQSSLRVSPNPAKHQWTISSKHHLIESIQIFDTHGKLLMHEAVNKASLIVDGYLFDIGLYIALVTTESGTQTVRLLRR